MNMVSAMDIDANWEWYVVLSKLDKSLTAFQLNPIFYKFS